MTKLTFAVLIIIAVIFLLPFYWNIVSSLKPSAEILRYPPTIFPSQLTTIQYDRLLGSSNGVFLLYIRNTLILAGSTILLVLFVSLLAAYAMSKLPFRGIKIIFLLILSIIMVPFQSLLIPLFDLFNKLNLIDTIPGLVLVYATFFMPFCIYMLKSYFGSLSDSLRESALIDGASELKILTKIYIPLSLPAIATVIVYVFLETWNDFILSLVFTSSNTVKNVQVGITDFAMQRFTMDWGVINAGTALSSIFPIIVFLLLQKYYVQGLTSGANKE